MDRVEYGIKLEQITKLRDRGDYVNAAKVADAIEWRKVKKWSDMSLAEEVYEKAGRASDARNICVYAYNRNLGGKRLVYKLAELSIAINDLDEADDLYREFVETAPNDMERYILLYKINCARGVTTDRLISILEEYKNNELDEQYEYELATLYLKAGRIDACIKECDDLILWFNEGAYVEKALRLKAQHAPLTKAQEAKLRMIDEMKAGGVRYESAVPQVEKIEKPATPTPVTPAPTVASSANVTADSADDISQYRVPEKDYSIYDTQNIQAELAKSMADIFASIQETKMESAMTVEPYVMPEVAETPTEVEAEPADVTETVAEADNDTLTAEEVAVAEDTEALEDEDVEEASSEVTEDTEVVDTAVLEASETVAAEDAKDSNVIATLVETADVQASVPEVSKELDLIDISKTINAINQPDVVDEPTKEIRVKTSHWKRYTSTLENEQVEPTTTQETLEAENANETEDIIEGQIDIMGWLDNMKNSPEQYQVYANVSAVAPKQEEPKRSETDETEESLAADTEEEELPEIGEETSEEIAPETEGPAEEIGDTTDIAVREITRQLMQEVNDEMDDTDSAPTQIAEEVYEEDEISGNEDYFLSDDEKKYLGKYLFISGLEANVAQIVHAKRRELPDNTSSFGNIVIMGKAKADKTGFAINLFKAIHVGEPISQHKIAKTNATNINRNGIIGSADKVKGSTLIIENAGMLTKAAISELVDFMNGDTGSMLVILTGESYTINRIFAENPIFSAMFNYTVEIREYSVNEMVALAKEYARIKGYMINEKALLKLYLLIGEIEGSNMGSEMEQVKVIVDKAIAHSHKKTKPNKYVQLKEKDF